jgi:SAM-dependent methyltransferase
MEHVLSVSEPLAVGECAVCGTDHHASIIFDLGDYAVSRCAACGLVYLSGERSAAAELTRYQKDHFDTGYMRGFDVDEIAAEQLESTRAALGWAGASFAGLPRWSPVLDIGCARGHFLSKLRSEMSERQFIGVDASRRMTEKGRAEFDLDLRGRTFEIAGLPPGCFGLVTAFDVLEHVVSPGDVLAKMLRLLHPNGWGVLEVPSERTIFRSLARAAFLVTAGTLAEPLRALYHPSHLSYFTPRSLVRLLGRLGAADIVVRCKEAHITRFGTERYRPLARVTIRAAVGLDRLLGTEAKLLVAFRRRA